MGSEGRGCPTSSGDRGDPMWPPPASNGARKWKVSGLRVGSRGAHDSDCRRSEEGALALAMASSPPPPPAPHI